METKPKRADAPTADTVVAASAPMFVRRGRTVQLPQGTYGPGAMIENLSPSDFVHLLASGFISSEAPILEPTAQNKQIHQGPVYNR
jgi:hypothetical protein